MGIVNVQLPPGKELNEFTIEMKFSSTNTTGLGEWGLNYVIYGVSLLSNNKISDYRSAGTFIGLMQGKFYIENNPGSDYATGEKILNYFLSDGKVHELVVILKDNITKVYIDNDLVLNEQYLYRFYNFDFLLNTNSYFAPRNDAIGYVYNYFSDSDFRDKMQSSDYNLYYFKLYDKEIQSKDFFKYTEYKPLYQYTNISYIKKDGKTFLRDMSGNENHLRLINSEQCYTGFEYNNLKSKE